LDGTRPRELGLLSKIWILLLVLLQHQLGRPAEHTEIAKIMQEQSIGWQGARLPKKDYTESTNDDDEDSYRSISAVVVCVQVTLNPYPLETARTKLEH